MVDLEDIAKAVSKSPVIGVYTPMRNTHSASYIAHHLHDASDEVLHDNKAGL